MKRTVVTTQLLYVTTGSTQTVNAPLCEARQGSAQSAMTQAKRQTLTQWMEPAPKQPARELARWCHNTAQDQDSKASG
jgi:hypothetical protein